MKTSNPALLTFLASATAFIKCNLLTLTPVSGAPLRFTDAARAVTFGGNVYEPLSFTVASISQSTDFTVDTVDFEITPGEANLINGVPFARYAATGRLRGALYRLDRLYAADWESLYASGPVGTGVHWSSGRVGDITNGGRSKFDMQGVSDAEVFARQIPADVISGSCRNTVFDARCGLVATTWQATSTTAAGSSKLLIKSGLAQTSDYFALGYIIFTSGQNTGVRRTVRTFGGGDLALLIGLPFTPVVGDAFTAYPGCSGEQGTCSGKFNNLPRFRGEPYVPQPEQSL